jgi:hypothetical protein
MLATESSMTMTTLATIAPMRATSNTRAHREFVSKMT